jgi:hypothetical protein
VAEPRISCVAYLGSSNGYGCDAERFRIEDFPVTSVKAHLHTTIAAMAIALGALSAPASATVSTPFGSINAGGFGVSTPWGGFSGPGFGVSTPWGGVSTPFFGLGNSGPGAGGYHTGFGVSTPWGGFSGPGFGIGFGPFGASFGGFGLGGPGYPPGVVPFFGLNEQQALSVKTPWGGASIPGFGICNLAMCAPMFGLNGAQNVGISTPFGGFYGPGFGVSTPWGGISGPGFGISTPWGGVSTPIFGLNGQPMAGGPQIVPVMVPYPVPMQGPMGPAQGGAQPTQCMINAVPALTKSVDDCEKAGGAVPPTRTSAVQEAKKE